MAQLPQNLILTQENLNKLRVIQYEAKIRHERARKAAKARGRIDFPAFPFECSWAFEEQFRKENQSN